MEFPKPDEKKLTDATKTVEESPMMRTSLYVERALKEETDKVLKELGIPFSTAIKMFMLAVIREQGIPDYVTHLRR